MIIVSNSSPLIGRLELLHGLFGVAPDRLEAGLLEVLVEVEVRSRVDLGKSRDLFM